MTEIDYKKLRIDDFAKCNLEGLRDCESTPSSNVINMYVDSLRSEVRDIKEPFSLERIYLPYAQGMKFKIDEDKIEADYIKLLSLKWAKADPEVLTGLNFEGYGFRLASGTKVNQELFNLLKRGDALHELSYTDKDELKDSVDLMLTPGGEGIGFDKGLLENYFVRNTTNVAPSKLNLNESGLKSFTDPYEKKCTIGSAFSKEDGMHLINNGFNVVRVSIVPYESLEKLL